jgi:hypothetical protein
MQVQTWPRQWIFKDHKNPQHTFLWMGSKAPCHKILWHVKDPLTNQRLIRKILTPLSIPPTCFQMSPLVELPESSAEQVSFPKPALSPS